MVRAAPPDGPAAPTSVRGVSPRRGPGAPCCRRRWCRCCPLRGSASVLSGEAGSLAASCCGPGTRQRKPQAQRPRSHETLWSTEPLFTFVTQLSLTLGPPPLLLPVPPHQLLLRRLHLAAPPERNPRPEHQRGGESEERLPGACRLAQHHADGRDEEARQRRADVPCAARDAEVSRSHRRSESQEVNQDLKKSLCCSVRPNGRRIVAWFVAQENGLGHPREEWARLKIRPSLLLLAPPVNYLKRESRSAVGEMANGSGWG